MDAWSAGSHSNPSGPSGSSRTIRAISGRSDATTGVPTAIASYSLLGVDRTRFWLAGSWSTAPISADATHCGSSAGDTAAIRWSRPVTSGSAARMARASRISPFPSRTRWRSSRPGAVSAATSRSMPRSGSMEPWNSRIGASAGSPSVSRRRFGLAAGGDQRGTQLRTTSILAGWYIAESTSAMPGLTVITAEQRSTRRASRARSTRRPSWGSRTALPVSRYSSWLSYTMGVVRGTFGPMAWSPVRSWACQMSTGPTAAVICRPQSASDLW